MFPFISLYHSEQYQAVFLSNFILKGDRFLEQSWDERQQLELWSFLLKTELSRPLERNEAKKQKPFLLFHGREIFSYALTQVKGTSLGKDY